MERKTKVWGFLYGLVLAGFTLYVLLDTFAISRVIVPVPTDHRSTSPAHTQTFPDELPTATVPANTTATVPDPTQGSTGPDVPVITDHSYHDSHISITLTQYREYDTTIYVADVELSSAEYLRTAFAKDSYGRNIREKTSDMAQRNGAILAINGDYYGSRQEGYVLRNGVLYREEGDPDREDLVIDYDGDFRIYSEGSVSARMLESYGAWQIFSFGPALVTNGQLSVDEDTEVAQATYSNPRTAIAQVDELHYLLVVSDGRTDRSEGLSLYQLGTFLQSLGVRTAYNLDGGGSSTMWFNGEVVNEPVNHGSEVSERKVSDIVYIGY